MKGVIADCLAKLVVEKFGQEKWNEILEKTGLKSANLFLPTADVDDGIIMGLVASAREVLNLTPTEAADAFGMYWVNSYAPKLYGIYFKKYGSAREFIKGTESIHESTTKSVPNAHPPHFKFKDLDDGALLVTYESPRKMIDLYVGLVKGVAHYYRTQIDIERLSEKQVKLRFG